MQKLVVICLIFSAIYASPVPPSGKIVGGTVTEIGQIPWQVALEDVEGVLFCGGSIISENYVLTAAHCTRFYSTDRLKIRSGTNCLQTGGVLTNVSDIIRHPNYNILLKDWDVSVIRLAQPLLMGESQQSVRLRMTEARENETALVSGWGVTKDGSLSRDLLSVEIPIVSRAECNLAYRNAITTNMICAGTVGRDSCQGDSGSGLVISNAQVGIVSNGFGCADRGHPGIYSNIANFADFINVASNFEAKWL